MAGRLSRSLGLSIVALLAGACGGGESDAVIDQSADQSVDSEATSASAGTTSVEAVPESDPGTSTSSEPVVCHNPAPIEIGLGATYDGENNDLPTACFWVDVPDGLTNVSFGLHGLSADLNLEVGYGFARTLLFNTGEYWASRAEQNGPESIDIPAPRSGPYFVKVGPGSPGATSNFSLLVVTSPESVTPATGRPLPRPDECGGPAEVLTVGGSASGEIVDGRSEPLPRSYFCVEAPAESGPLTVEVAVADGLLDLFVSRVGSNEVWTDRSRSETLSVTIEAPEPTAYYIDIAPALPGATSAFDISVSG